MQRRHSVRHLLWRGGIAAVANALMFTGLYPLVPWAVRRLRKEEPGTLRAALGEWGMSLLVSAARPVGHLGLPGARGRGPRPVIVLHGYAMNRANFVVLGRRLAKAGLGPVFGFEYWTFGRVAAAARQLGWFVDQVREATGADQVDVIGHSMGGVVGLYYVTLAGGDGAVANLVTLGSPLQGTDVSAPVGHAGRELVVGSKLMARLASATLPAKTKILTIWSKADNLVPGGSQKPLPGAEAITYDDLGHVTLLGSRRVASEIIERLSR
jgi:triacylglycerol esterase/lipase EstA (alpha/beta hydrolase family)